MHNNPTAIHTEHEAEARSQSERASAAEAKLQEARLALQRYRIDAAQGRPVTAIPGFLRALEKALS